MQSNDLSSLTAKAINCIRGEYCIFSDVNFQLQAGEILQIVGANGSGKTSLLRMLAGLSEPERGDISWGRLNIYRDQSDYAHQRLYIGHLPGIKLGLTVDENIQIMCALYPESTEISVDEALNLLALSPYRYARCATLSAGQQRRVALSRLLLCRAKVWLLDEPLTAIDVAGLAQLQALFRRHCQQGGMVMFTTHQPFDLPELTVQQLLLSQEKTYYVTV